MLRFYKLWSQVPAEENPKGFPGVWPKTSFNLQPGQELPPGDWMVLEEADYIAYLATHQATFDAWKASSPDELRKIRQQKLEQKLYWGEKTLKEIRLYLEGIPDLSETEMDKFTLVLASLRMGLLVAAQTKLTALNTQGNVVLSANYDPSILGTDDFQGTVLQKFLNMIQQGIPS